MDAKDERNPLSRHAPSRRKQSPAPAAVNEKPAYPGTRLKLTFAGKQRTTMDLSDFKPASLAVEVTKLVWQNYQDEAAYRSRTAVDNATLTIKRFSAYFDSVSRNINGLADITVADINGFEVWLAKAVGADTDALWRQVNSLINLLRRAKEAGAPIDKDVQARCLFTLQHNARGESNETRDAYNDLTMANLRAAARAEAKQAIVRLYIGDRIARRGLPPWEYGQSLENLVWQVRNMGLPAPEQSRALKPIASAQGWSRETAYNYVYMNASDFVSVYILLLDATGLPTECIRELDANCLEQLNPPGGQTRLRYIKRRRFNDESEQKLTVDTRGRFSVGYIVRRVLRMTRTARLQLGYGELEGPLFLRRHNLKISDFSVAKDAVQGFLARNPIIIDTEGAKLQWLGLSRVRKTVKAADWLETGGTVELMGADHSVKTLLRHYVKLPHLQNIHEQVIAEGIQSAFDAAMAPRVLDTGAAALLTEQPAKAAKDIGITEQQAADVASEAADVWIASCLGGAEAYSRKSDKSCAAPVWGCLDCRNAIFTERKIPGLVRLLNHILSQRQRMSLVNWRNRYAFAYTRIMQILYLYPPAAVRAATEEAAGDEGRDFTIAQLTYRID